MLLPKIKYLSSEKDNRPITCLNTFYKIFTAVLESYMKEHAIRNDVWDKKSGTGGTSKKERRHT